MAFSRRRRSPFRISEKGWNKTASQFLTKSLCLHKPVCGACPLLSSLLINIYFRDALKEIKRNNHTMADLRDLLWTKRKVIVPFVFSNSCCMVCQRSAWHACTVYKGLTHIQKFYFFFWFTWRSASSQVDYLINVVSIFRPFEKNDLNLIKVKT